MRFSVVLCSLVCSTSLALTIAKRDQTAAVAALEQREEPVVQVIKQITTTKAPKVKVTKEQEVKTKAVKATPTKVVVVPTYFAGCEAAARVSQGDDCGVYGTVSSPHNPYVIDDTPLDSCSNACVCGDSRIDCKAFAWTSLGDNSGLGNCTLYDHTLETMGYSGGSARMLTTSTLFQSQSLTFSAVLYDRKCYHRSTPTSSMPIHTMGAYETKARKRAQVDDYVVGALMGI